MMSFFPLVEWNCFFYEHWILKHWQNYIAMYKWDQTQSQGKMRLGVGGVEGQDV